MSRRLVLGGRVAAKSRRGLAAARDAFQDGTIVAALRCYPSKTAALRGLAANRDSAGIATRRIACREDRVSENLVVESRMPEANVTLAGAAKASADGGSRGD